MVDDMVKSKTDPRVVAMFKKLISIIKAQEKQIELANSLPASTNASWRYLGKGVDDGARGRE